jgi:hypothetical protein
LERLSRVSSFGRRNPLLLLPGLPPLCVLED